MADAWREVIVEWQGDGAFLGANTTGGRIQMGKMGNEQGLSPMELLLAGLAGCTGIDVVSILEKKHKSPENIVIKVRGQRAEEHPRVYTDIEILYLFWGEDLDRRSIEQAIRLSHEKYCSASAMLGVKANINYSYEINQNWKA